MTDWFKKHNKDIDWLVEHDNKLNNHGLEAPPEKDDKSVISNMPTEDKGEVNPFVSMMNSPFISMVFDETMEEIEIEIDEDEPDQYTVPADEPTVLNEEE